MFLKNRSAKGEKQGGAKLNDKKSVKFAIFTREVLVTRGLLTIWCQEIYYWSYYQR
jgi:hypothetical protein